MKYFLMLTVLLSLIPTFARTDMNSCLEREMIQRDELVSKAKDALNRDMQDCLRFPIEEKYYKCTSQAKVKFDNEMERISSVFKLRRRACLKYPFL